MGKVAQLQETERAGPLLFSRAPAQSLPSMRRSSAKEGRFSFLANHTLLIYKHTYTPAVQQVSLLASKESRRCCWSATGFLLVCWLAAGQQQGAQQTTVASSRPAKSSKKFLGGVARRQVLRGNRLQQRSLNQPSSPQVTPHISQSCIFPRSLILSHL